MASNLAQKLTDNERDVIQSAFAVVDWDRGPLSQEEVDEYDQILRKLGAENGYTSPWKSLKTKRTNK